ncbi:MAG TPA: CGNR zinc finger domain-containing protein [Galbitalea sp.]|jgi:predicted RNA-binding Zn ribbon-like protein|nr:CGNR zinc finger domain-containing protein [Galbitalea sp.]
MAISQDAGQWIGSPGAERWWFDAGGAALDFVYTAEFATDFGTFRVPESVADWLTGRFPDIRGEIGARELEDAQALRDAVTGIATALARGRGVSSDDIDVLNLYAATPDIPPVLAGSTRQAGRIGIRPAQALSAMAREAVGMFGTDNRERVRECAADDCELVFYDDSRAGSRRWCSMQRCGNRAKVRAYRSRS